MIFMILRYKCHCLYYCFFIFGIDSSVRNLEDAQCMKGNKLRRRTSWYCKLPTWWHVLKCRFVLITKLLIYLQGYWKGEDGDSFNICLTYLLPYRWVPAFWFRLGGFTPGTPVGHLPRKPKPDFHQAMGGDAAQELYEAFVQKLRTEGPPKAVQTGVFGAMMQASLEEGGYCVDGNQKSDWLTSWGW